MKKVLLLLLIFVLCLTFFVGCDNGNYQVSSSNAPDYNVSAENSSAEESSEAESKSESSASEESSETESEKENHMNGFQCESYEYVNTGKLRFIGIDAYRTGDDWDALWERSSEFLPQLESMLDEYGAFVSYPSSLMHSGGKDVGVEEHFLAGYFFKADTPVPEGYDYYDIEAEILGYGIYTTDNFPGDMESVYVMARDKILNDGYLIPYPQGYCHAEVYTDGRDFEGALRIGYMFPTNRSR